MDTFSASAKPRGSPSPVPAPLSKNNAHVEEKNNSIIGKVVRYDHHDSQIKVDLLNHMYQALHLLVNWFLPGRKLLDTVRAWNHSTKAYDQLQKPYRRMLAWINVPEEKKWCLHAARATRGLASLHHEVRYYYEQSSYELAKRR